MLFLWCLCQARPHKGLHSGILACSHEDWGWGPIVDLVEHEGVTERVISDKDSPVVSNSRPFNDMSLHLFTEPLQPRPG